MLHPNQFQVNQAWIFFKLNHAAVHIESDGDFNLFALMDAASCFILSSTPVPTSQAEPSKMEVKRLFKEAQAHRQQLPTTLFVPTEQTAILLAVKAERQGVAVMRVSNAELEPFVGEAKEGFKAQFGGGIT